jgi:HPt (histidine-containing phosphotransfer) domain-containing protein
LRRLAHQLKGSCAGYGFPTIGDAAARLETSLETHAALEQVSTQVADLVDLCKRARAGSGSIAA